MGNVKWNPDSGKVPNNANYCFRMGSQHIRWQQVILKVPLSLWLISIFRPAVRQIHDVGAGLFSKGLARRALIQQLTFCSLTWHQGLREGRQILGISKSLCALSVGWRLFAFNWTQQPFCVMLISSGYESERKKWTLVTEERERLAEDFSLVRQCTHLSFS